MTILDYGVFMSAGVIGAFYDSRFGFGIIALWGLLKLTRAI